jgi:hypothetical protein
MEEVELGLKGRGCHRVIVNFPSCYSHRLSWSLVFLKVNAVVVVVTWWWRQVVRQVYRDVGLVIGYWRLVVVAAAAAAVVVVVVVVAGGLAPSPTGGHHRHCHFDDDDEARCRLAEVLVRIAAVGEHLDLAAAAEHDEMNLKYHFAVVIDEVVAVPEAGVAVVVVVEIVMTMLV